MPKLSNSQGMAVIAVTTIVVAGWLYLERTERTARTAPAIEPEEIDPALPDDDMLGFVEIPAGSFLMGSDPRVDPRAYENERWAASSFQGTVELPAFYVGRYEVTLAQFRAFVEATGHRAGTRALAGERDHPVGFVSWPDTLAYCRWLEETLDQWPNTPPTIRRLLDDGWHVTLPTEAQWEKAARGPDGRIFPWGNTPRPDRANYEGSSVRPVGSYECPECPYGLSDMSGNVWELTRSPYQPYPYDSALDDIDLDEDALWVMRGGSYSDTEQNIRAAVRGGADPGARRPFIGFRLVLAFDER